MKKLAIALAFAVGLISPSFAQTGTPKTQSVMTAEVNAIITDNVTGGITPFDARQVLLDLIASTPLISATVGVPPSVTGLSPGVCSGTSSDASTINTILATNQDLGFPASIICNLSSPISLSATGNNNNWLLGGGFNTILQPNASIASIVDVGSTNNAYVNIGNFLFNQVGTEATSGIHYHPGASNNLSRFHDLLLLGFTNGILVDGANTDGYHIYNSFFLNNTTAINNTNFGINSSIYSNYFLGGNGINFALSARQNEGTRTFNNSILPATAGAHAVTISAGLELSFFFNIFDQILAHGVTIDATVNPVSSTKFVGNWFGASASVAAGQDGIRMSGPVDMTHFTNNTIVGWTEYGINTQAGGVNGLLLFGNKFYSNLTADLNMNNVGGAVLIGNRLSSAAGSWIETAMAGPIMAFGNVCTHAATGVQATDIILGDTTCAPNQIPALNITQNLKITGTTAPSFANGTLGFYADATFGGLVRGQGATWDVTILNAAGNAVFAVPHNSTGGIFGSVAGTTVDVIAVSDAASTTGSALNIGAQAASGTSINGQNIKFARFNSGGVRTVDTLIDSSAGNLTWTGAAFVANQYIAIAAASAVGAGQISYGGTTVAAGASTGGGTCPTGALGGGTVAGCAIVNVAGTQRGIPFF